MWNGYVPPQLTKHFIVAVKGTEGIFAQKRKRETVQFAYIIVVDPHLVLSNHISHLCEPI